MLCCLSLCRLPRWYPGVCLQAGPMEGRDCTAQSVCVCMRDYSLWGRVCWVWVWPFIQYIRVLYKSGNCTSPVRVVYRSGGSVSVKNAMIVWSSTSEEACYMYVPVSLVWWVWFEAFYTSTPSEEWCHLVGIHRYTHVIANIYTPPVVCIHRLMHTSCKHKFHFQLAHYYTIHITCIYM